MRPSVLSAWKPWNVPNEGWTNFPYPDSIGLLTVGMGDMIDPDRGGDPYSLPWTIGGAPADATTVRDQLEALKALYPGVQSLAAAPYTTIRLSDDAILALIANRIAANEVDLRKSFPNWDSFPADGQAAIMSKAWAMGSGFVPVLGFTKFAELVNAGQWAASIPEGHYHGAGTQGRQAQEDVALANADAVSRGVGNPATLYWPGQASGLGTLGRAGILAGLALGAGVATEWAWPGSLGPASHLARAALRSLKGLLS